MLAKVSCTIVSPLNDWLLFQKLSDFLANFGSCFIFRHDLKCFKRKKLQKGIFWARIFHLFLYFWLFLQLQNKEPLNFFADKIMRVIHLTESRWPNEYDQTMTTMNLNNCTWPKLKLTNLIKLTNLNFTSRVLLTSVPDVFFLVEERSEAGQVSQPVQACEPGLGDLSKPTETAYFLG